jgi:two-component system response regulator YesN
MRIVIVEDELKTRNGIINLINKYCQGHEIVGEAENGVVGLEVIENEKPDLIIMDIRMPEMDGLEMLAQLKKKEIKTKIIILSGYSEFEYAQKAIAFGVSEYLLKPILVEHLMNAMEKVNKELIAEKQLSGGKDATAPVELLLLNYILGSHDEVKALEKQLKDFYDIDSEKSFVTVLVYICDHSEENKEVIKKTLIRKMQELYQDKYYIVDVDAYKELVIFIQDSMNCSRIEKLFQERIIPEIHGNRIMNIVFGSVCVNGLNDIKSSLQDLRKLLNWSIVLGEDVLLSYPKLQKIFTKAIQYPIDIENHIKSAVYSNDTAKIHLYNQEFLDWWRKDLYQPSGVIDSFVRFASSIINAVKEINYDLFCSLNQKNTLQKIIDAFTWYEIKGALCAIVDKITSYEKKDQNTNNLLVNKMQNMIAECYKESISLDEIAAKLHVTPEYLGSLFLKETGVNFSTYLKLFRINKAKELILSSDLKIYDIARETGYTDPKYFCRVFKEVAGMSTTEYQRKNK